MDMYGFKTARPVTEGSVPPIGSAMIIVSENGISTLSGGNRTKGDMKTLLNVVCPDIRAGKCKIYVTWAGRYSSDVFVIDETSVNLLEKELISWL